MHDDHICYNHISQSYDTEKIIKNSETDDII